MRPSSVCLVIAAAALGPASALAADSPRRPYAQRGGEVRIYPAPEQRSIAVEKRAGERLVVIDSDGAVLRRSFVDPDAPRRVEKRVYVRDDHRKEHFLYGGFFGLDRWGVSRGDW